MAEHQTVSAKVVSRGELWPWQLPLFALSTASCASALDLAVSLRWHPGALSELRSLAQLFAIELALLWPLCLVLFTLLGVLVQRFVKREAAVAGALSAAALSVIGVVPLSTLLGIVRFGGGHKPQLQLFSLCLAGLWLVVPCIALAPHVLGRASRAQLTGLVASFVVGSLAVTGWSWHRAFPRRVREKVVAQVASDRPKHIVLITVDTLRPDFLSTYNPSARATPQIDALGRDSLVFEHAVALAPWTKPSLASLLTGLSPSAHHVTDRYDALDDKLDTIAERFAAGGYHTGVVAFNPFLDPSSNLSQGFIDSACFPRGNLGVSLGAQAVAHFWLPMRQDPSNTPALTVRAKEWLDAHAHEPFFFWLHYYDPHQPYEPPAKYMPKGKPPSPELRTFDSFREVRGGYMRLSAPEREWIRQLYAGEVQQADEEVGKVLAELKKLGIYEDSVIVFASDHGEEFWEHGGFEHGHSLYEEVMHVPLMIKLPAKAQTGRVATRVSLASVYPTLSALAALPQGRDGLARLMPLVDTLAGQSTISDRDVSFVGQALLYYEDKISVTRNGKKYIRSLASGREELFDLASDPGEHRSDADTAPELKLELRSALRSQLHTDGGREDVLDNGVATPTQKHKAASPEMLRSLRALGYVQ